MALLVSQTYAGTYLAAADLLPLGRRRNAVIHATAEEDFGQDGKRRPLIVLDLVSPSGKAWPKRAPMNKTNSIQLAAAFGDDAHTWPGRTIEIWAENVMYQGRLVPGVKVLPALPPQASQPAQPPPVMSAPVANPDEPPGAPPGGGDLDDEIPFGPCVQ